MTQHVLNCLPSRNTERDWTFSDARQAGLLALDVIPASVDLREDWWAIGNQGNTGACVGWAVADSALRWLFVKANRLDKAELLSVRYVWMAAKETDDLSSRPTTFIETGTTSVKAAMDVVRDYGIVLDTLLPFANGQLYTGAMHVFYAHAASLRIASYFNLGRDLQDWRSWIVNRGPIITRLDIDQTWIDANKDNANLNVYQPDPAGQGHAVALVGYTEDYFIVRNSWGTDWGDGGYAYASNAYAAAAFTEAYGVTV